MKSTGLFGKNSGRVGGVVYSNYRGEQIVRAYQPRVSNPKSTAQVAQRAKFKLLSQLASILSVEINSSYVSDQRKLTNRNLWVRNTFDNVVYANNTASLPIEDIVLTNSRENAITFAPNQTIVAGTNVPILISQSFIGGKVRFVYLSYTDGGDINVLYTQELAVEDTGEGAGLVQWPVPNRQDVKRVVMYAYDVDESISSTYSNVEALGDDAEVDVIARNFAGALRFSASLNLPIQLPV